MAIAQRLRSGEEYDLAERYDWALKEGNFLLERLLDLYEPQKLSTTEE